MFWGLGGCFRGVLGWGGGGCTGNQGHVLSHTHPHPHTKLSTAHLTLTFMCMVLNRGGYLP